MAITVLNCIGTFCKFAGSGIAIEFNLLSLDNGFLHTCKSRAQGNAVMKVAAVGKTNCASFVS